MLTGIKVVEDDLLTGYEHNLCQFIDCYHQIIESGEILHKPGSSRV